MGRLKYNIEEGNPFGLPASEQKLSILIGMDSFDYIITDKDLQISVFKSYALNQPASSNSYSEFEDFYRGDALLNRNYQQCVVTIYSPYFTLVPGNFFKASESPSYLDQVAELEKSFDTAFEVLAEGNHYNVFARHNFLSDWCKAKFPSYQGSHIISGLIRYALLDKANENRDRLYFHRSAHLLSVVLVKDNHLHFANVFEIPTPEHLIYYLGLIFNQLKVSQMTTQAFLTDGFSEEDEYTKLMYKYLSNVSNRDLPSSLSLLPSLQRAPVNQILLPAVALI